jgi:hypothetical protein
MGEERRISTTVAAEIAGYSAKQLLRYAKRGQVPGAYQLVPGGAWRFNERRLRNWVRKREAECQSNPAIGNTSRRTSIDVTGSIGSVARSADGSLEERYERILSLRLAPGKRKC